MNIHSTPTWPFVVAGAAMFAVWLHFMLRLARAAALSSSLQVLALTHAPVSTGSGVQEAPQVLAAREALQRAERSRVRAMLLCAMVWLIAIPFMVVVGMGG